MTPTGARHCPPSAIVEPERLSASLNRPFLPATFPSAVPLHSHTEHRPPGAAQRPARSPLPPVPPPAPWQSPAGSPRRSPRSVHATHDGGGAKEGAARGRGPSSAGKDVSTASPAPYPHASQSGARTQLSARQPIRGGETVIEEDAFFSPERGQTVKTQQILFKRFRFICILCCKTLCFNSKLQKRQYVLLSFYFTMERFTKTVDYFSCV